MSTTTATKTVNVLRESFARYGLPQQLVSDNGPQFVAEEFSLFLKLNGVKHIRCAPYHPASNGAVERMVQTMKQSLKAGLSQGVPVEQGLMKFLLQYRITPHAVTGASPSSLFLGRTIRMRLDLLHPNIGSRVQTKQLHRKAAVDTHRRLRQFAAGQHIMTRDFYNGARWIPGTVVDQTGPVSYRVRVQGGRVWRRHVDHLLEASGEGVHRDHSQQNADSELDVMPGNNSALRPPTTDNLTLQLKLMNSLNLLLMQTRKVTRSQMLELSQRSLPDIPQDREDLHHASKIMLTVKGCIRFSGGRCCVSTELIVIIVIVIST